MLGKTNRCPDCHSHSQRDRRSVAFPPPSRSHAFHRHGLIKIRLLLLLSTSSSNRQKHPYCELLVSLARCSSERAHSWHEMASCFLPSFSSTTALLYQASGSSGANDVAWSNAASASSRRPRAKR